MLTNILALDIIIIIFIFNLNISAWHEIWQRRFKSHKDWHRREEYGLSQHLIDKYRYGREKSE